MDRGPRIGVTKAFLCQLWTLLKGVGLRVFGLAFQIAGLLDWLTDLFSRQLDCVILSTLVPQINVC